MFQYGPTAAMRMFDASGRELGRLELDWRNASDGAPAHDVPYQFYPTPVFTSDGYGYSFDDTQGLLRLEITLPAAGSDTAAEAAVGDDAASTPVQASPAGGAARGPGHLRAVRGRGRRGAAARDRHRNRASG